MVFCNEEYEGGYDGIDGVTILILIDGFLQFSTSFFYCFRFKGHNPYFNRWFSAI